MFNPTIPLYNLFDHYSLSKPIGEGSFGDVRLATVQKPLDYTRDSLDNYFSELKYGEFFNWDNDTTSSQNRRLRLEKGACVAIKTYRDKAKNALDYWKWREFQFYCEVPNHKNIIQFYETFIDDSEYRCHMVMEAMDMDLHAFIYNRWESVPENQCTTRPKPLDVQIIKSIARQVIQGLTHVHFHGYMHRDIKPDNILLRRTADGDLEVKLADFGLSRRVDFPEQFTSYISTRWYRAPELLLCRASYSYAMDIWAFGTVITELANLQPLFSGKSNTDQLFRQMVFLGTPSTESLGGPWPEFEHLYSRLGYDSDFVNTLDTLIL